MLKLMLINIYLVCWRHGHCIGYLHCTSDK